MIPTKIDNLIRTLQEKNKSGELFWSLTSQTQFRLELESGIITVNLWNTPNDKFIGIDIFNLEGKLIERFNASEKEAVFDYRRIQEFYYSIAKSYRERSDDIIDSMISEVNNNKK